MFCMKLEIKYSILFYSIAGGQVVIGWFNPKLAEVKGCLEVVPGFKPTNLCSLAKCYGNVVTLLECVKCII